MLRTSRRQGFELFTQLQVQSVNVQRRGFAGPHRLIRWTLFFGESAHRVRTTTAGYAGFEIAYPDYRPFGVSVEKTCVTSMGCLDNLLKRSGKAGMSGWVL